MTVRTNSLGMRDKEYDLTHNYTKRVLLLGDSFTFGYGLNIEDIFDSKLEALLNQSGEKAIVLNAGVGGWGTLQETKYARDNFTRLKPDIVIITFCGNDLWDDFNYQNNLDLEKGLFYFPGKIFLRDHSHFFRLVVAKNHVIWWKWMRRKKIKEAKEHKKSIDEDRQSATILVEENWDNTLEAIRKFHKEFLEYNPNGIVLVQATNPLNETIRKHLKSFSNGRDLVYVDLYDDVVVLEEKERTTSLKDVHWSPKMHSISAENLYRAIRDLTPQ